MNKHILLVIISAIFFIGGCATSAKEIHSAKEREMTVGIVQKEIYVGMSQVTVAEALGSPNIVTADEDQKETWIYDKIATEASYINRSGGIGAGGGIGMADGSLFDNTAGLLLGLINSNYAKASGASSTTQKTLTVIIKFNKDKKVDSFSYHASKF